MKVLQQVKIALLLSFLFSLINWPYLASLHKQFIDLGDITISYLITLFVLGTYIAILHIILGRYILMILLVIIYLFSSIFSYYKYHYKIDVNEQLILSILDTCYAEAWELANWNLASWFFLFGICISFIAIFLIIKNKAKFIHKLLAVPIIAIMMMSFLLLGAKHTYHEVSNATIRAQYKRIEFFLPFNFISQALYYFRLYKKNDQINTKFRQESLENLKVFSNIKNTDNLKVILVIGESARSKNFSLNGYKKLTNPLLSRIPNLYSFKNVYCSQTYTVAAIPYIIYNQGNKGVSLSEIMRQAGFNTYWYTTQSTSGGTVWRDSAIGTNHHINRTNINQTTFFDLIYDEMLLQYFIPNINRSENAFFVIHTMGSHNYYDQRYPESFKTFKPTCTKNYREGTPKCIDLEKLHNSYDNTIIYTDYILNEIITNLKDKNALLLYISDHGESLGEEGRYGHGHDLSDAPEQGHIPMILWASDKFLESAENNKKIISSSKRINEILSQNVVFHSIPECIGISSNILDSSKSICEIK